MGAVFAVPASAGQIGTVFYIDMENHNLTQPSSVTSPQQLQGNVAAPYLNSLMTPGNPNAARPPGPATITTWHPEFTRRCRIISGRKPARISG